jgi:hypothetical protein
VLQVANRLGFTESRTHFSAWAVTSAPLILGFDVTNATLMELAYPIITNEDVLHVNQAVRSGKGEQSLDLATRRMLFIALSLLAHSQWAGHPGRLVLNATKTFVTATEHGASASHATQEVFPDWQVSSVGYEIRTTVTLWSFGPF